MMGPRVIGMQPLHWGILGALYIFFFTSDYSTEDGISDRFDEGEG
jgi:hypothetical protein